MAAKNGNKGRSTGDASAATSADDDAGIRELIDGNGAGSGTVDGEGPQLGDATSGNESTSRDSGSESERSGIDSGSGESESGIFSESARTGTENRRTRNRSRSARRTSASAASEETRTVSDDLSRPISPPKKPKIETDLDSIPTVNAEIIGDVFAFAFWGIGQATGIPEWELPEDDAETIGKNGEKWLKSLGKKRAANVMKGLSKIGPSLAFFGSLGMALVPRVKLTINAGKHGAIKPIQERKATGTSGNTNQPVAPVSPETTGNVSDIGSAAERSRAFTAKDFSEVTQGFAGLDDGLPVS